MYSVAACFVEVLLVGGDLFVDLFDDCVLGLTHMECPDCDLVIFFPEINRGFKFISTKSIVMLCDRSIVSFLRPSSMRNLFDVALYSTLNGEHADGLLPTLFDSSLNSPHLTELEISF